jgi:hypothetical protein
MMAPWMADISAVGRLVTQPHPAGGAVTWVQVPRLKCQWQQMVATAVDHLRVADSTRAVAFESEQRRLSSMHVRRAFLSGRARGLEEARMQQEERLEAACDRALRQREQEVAAAAAKLAAAGARDARRKGEVRLTEARQR